MAEQVIKFRPARHTPTTRSVAIKLAGYTQTALAEDLGVAIGTYKSVVQGRKKSMRVANHLAAKLNTNIHVLFPDGRYDHEEIGA